MKHLIIILSIVLTVVFCGNVLAETVTLPDGQEVPLDGLSSGEKQSMMNYIDKISKAQKAAKVAKEASGVVEAIKNADPTALNEWRQLITGTIKDIATDLGVTVNEFIKTPAGMGVAALIIYKVAGKDVLSAAVDIVLAIPMWVVVMLILWYLQRQYLTTTVIYKKIEEVEMENGKTKVVKSEPVQAHRYNWASADSRTTMACFLYGTMIVITFTCILIVFVF